MYLLSFAHSFLKVSLKLKKDNSYKLRLNLQNNLISIDIKKDALIITIKDNDYKKVSETILRLE